MNREVSVNIKVNTHKLEIFIYEWRRNNPAVKDILAIKGVKGICWKSKHWVFVLCSNADSNYCQSKIQKILDNRYPEEELDCQPYISVERGKQND